MPDLDAASVQQVLDVSKRQQKPDVKQHRHADDPGARLEVPERGAFVYPARLAVHLGLPLAKFF